MSQQAPVGPRPTIQIVGRGRAGFSLHDALLSVGWKSAPPLGRGDISATGAQVDVIALAVPDDAIAEVAASIPPSDVPLIHLSGSRPLTELGQHRNVGSLHPLVSMPNRTVGAKRLLADCFFAVAGDPITIEMARSLGGRWQTVPDDKRAIYHAAATVAANHTVALTAQVEDLARAAGIEAEPLFELMHTTLENVRALGPKEALTGPASRGDWATIRTHLDAIGPRHEQLYRAAFAEVVRLTSHTPPEDLA